MKQLLDSKTFFHSFKGVVNLIISMMTQIYITGKACEGLTSEIGYYLRSLLASGSHFHLWWKESLQIRTH